MRGSRSGRPIMAALDLLGRRWTLRILWELREERLGFRALQERCGKVSPTIISRRTRELRESAILDVDGDGRYGFTRLGRELLEVLAALNAWARKWDAKLNGRARPAR